MAEQSEMVERIARALASEDACDPSFVDRTGRVQWTYHVGAARAALCAMLSPTDDMIDAAHAADVTAWGPYPAWKAMIDAALREPDHAE